MTYQQFESQVLSTQASIMFSKAQTDMDKRKDQWRQLQRLYLLKLPVTKYVQGLLFELESHIAQIQSFEKLRNQQRSQNYETIYQFALEERNLSSKIENLEKQRDELKKINSSQYEQLKQSKKALKEYRVRAKQKQQKLTLELQKLNNKLEEWMNKSNSFEKDCKSMERRYNFEKKERQELDEKYKSLNEKSQKKYRQYEHLLQKKTQRRQVQVIEDFQQRAELLSIQHKESQQRFLRRHKAPKDIESMRELSTKNRPTTK